MSDLTLSVVSVSVCVALVTGDHRRLFEDCWPLKNEMTQKLFKPLMSRMRYNVSWRLHHSAYTEAPFSYETIISCVCY